MFKATVSDVRLWRSMLAAISSLVDEASFDLTPEGVTLRSMDPSHVAMVDFEWPKSAFTTYEASSASKLRVNLGHFLKLLKRAKSEDTLEIVYDEERRKVELLLTNNIKKMFTVPTLESAEEETPTPKIEFKTSIKLDANTFKEMMEDINTISDNIRFEVKDDKLIITTSAELSSARFEVEKGSEAVLEMRVEEPSKATFNLNYLVEMVKAGAIASEVLTFQFSTDMPLKLEFHMPQDCRLVYYLAPRIEAE